MPIVFIGDALISIFRIKVSIIFMNTFYWILIIISEVYECIIFWYYLLKGLMIVILI